ncbi:hypothetical protein JOC58_001907 [Paenibacillus hunanensis]|uniref:Uncharacterized protein n=1 Tax=Paenibacillus hunanensis TaxID=539262 RepID=A0ABU1IXN1_9BACL|nr:hypothetical protein [Paenibacillus hunanensis]
MERVGRIARFMFWQVHGDDLNGDMQPLQPLQLPYSMYPVAV